MRSTHLAVADREAFAVQDSAGWRQARCGKLTASRLADAVARTKTGWSASRGAYMAQLVAERLTGIPVSTVTNAAMRWGSDTEALARAAYQFHTDQAVDEVGFVGHPKIAMSGASPDGLIGQEGLLEIKCPTTITHIETLAAGQAPGKCLPQVYWQMACTGRRWCDFVSFDPRLPEDLKLFIVRIERDEAAIADYEAMVEDFLGEVDARLMALPRWMHVEAAA